MPKPEDDARWSTASTWPGPVGWWYIPLIWLVIVLVATLAWSYT